MDAYNSVVNTIALSLGAAWASGINLYAAILVLGLLGTTGNIALPESLHVLENPLVIGAAGVMYVVEFFADKIPGLDTGWDAVHTFVRVPAGVMLAAGAVGDVNIGVAVAAGILGGGISAGSHAAKAGSRVLINTSPEPVTNWAASITEDLVVIGGLWTALKHPWWFIVFLVLFVLLLVWLLPKLWRGIKKILGLIARLFRRGQQSATNAAAAQDPVPDQTAKPGPGGIDLRLKQLEELKDQGLISEQEYREKRGTILNQL